ncbi:MAG: O-antigen ligase family protein [Desulfuromonadales bacterium]|nr:O-antigen ligase family protein [Desulfuromonadales bacterium]
MKRIWGIAAVLLMLQFVNTSFIAATGKVGTLYIVSFFTLFCCCVFFQQSRPIFLSRIHGWLIALWLFIVAGCFFAVNVPWATLWGGIAAVYLLVFFLITNLSRHRPDFARAFIDTMLFCGLLAALLGIYEYAYFHVCGATSSSQIPYLLPPDRDPRVSGMYGQSNLFALFLALTALAYIYSYLHGSLMSWNRSRWFSYLRFIPVTIVFLTFFLTRSKGGFLSLFLTLCGMLWLIVSKRYLADNRHARKEFFLILASLTAAFILSRLTLIAGIEEIVATRSFSDTGTNPSGRFVFWTSAILIFLDHPWLGAGLDNYRFLMNSYGPAAHDLLGFVEFEAMKSTFWAHNELFQLLAEGGIFLFGGIVFFLIRFFKNIWKHFIRPSTITNPLFFYSHLFLLPFIIQSQFSWPLRHPALGLLFISFSAILAAQYPLRAITLPQITRVAAVTVFICALIITGVLFMQERKIVDFKKEFQSKELETTLDEFSALAENPYSSYRVLYNTMPYYVIAALASPEDSFAQRILPYSEKLVRLVGKGGQWYDLAQLYSRLGREKDAETAIWKAYELKPMDQTIFNFLHHLNVIKASRATGRPIESFYPKMIEPIKINMLEPGDD